MGADPLLRPGGIGDQVIDTPEVNPVIGNLNYGRRHTAATVCYRVPDKALGTTQVVGGNHGRC